MNTINILIFMRKDFCKVKKSRNLWYLFPQIGRKFFFVSKNFRKLGFLKSLIRIFKNFYSEKSQNLQKLQKILLVKMCMPKVTNLSKCFYANSIKFGPYYLKICSLHKIIQSVKLTPQICPIYNLHSDALTSLFAQFKFAQYRLVQIRSNSLRKFFLLYLISYLLLLNL